jgi:hypothetical protein
MSTATFRFEHAAYAMRSVGGTLATDAPVFLGFSAALFRDDEWPRVAAPLLRDTLAQTRGPVLVMIPDYMARYNVAAVTKYEPDDARTIKRALKDFAACRDAVLAAVAGCPDSQRARLSVLHGNTYPDPDAQRVSRALEAIYQRGSSQLQPALGGDSKQPAPKVELSTAAETKDLSPFWTDEAARAFAAATDEHCVGYARRRRPNVSLTSDSGQRSLKHFRGYLFAELPSLAMGITNPQTGVHYNALFHPVPAVRPPASGSGAESKAPSRGQQSLMHDQCADSPIATLTEMVWRGFGAPHTVQTLKYNVLVHEQPSSAVAGGATLKSGMCPLSRSLHFALLSFAPLCD